MSALSFPTSPTLYSTYTNAATGQTWYWDGTSWRYGQGPGAVDASFASVTVLLPMDAAAGDVPSRNLGSAGLLTPSYYRNMAVCSAASSPFGGTSCAHPESPLSSILFASNSAWAFGTGDFTIEGFCNPTTSNVTGLNQYLVSIRNNGNTSNLVEIAQHFTDNKLMFALYTSGGADNSITASSALTLNTWTHWAVSRVSGVSYASMGGVSMGSHADTNNYSAADLCIGHSGYGASSDFTFRGYQKAIRITKGVGRYNASTFTPPSTAFPTR